ncbi:hypothetical protein PENFLA_c027G06212 [Penicillium flavigenum]|uniref:Acyl-CoA dehydrogenase NM domain-like protein n=1 Tax=Penicillium flavigenum TaxID=254877 RepID=A0A1V6SS28_9EURO|nr:hypothetical protein PENFLA_c027G06212 [Penicillium flavigenum]
MSFPSLELVHLPLFKPIPEHTPDHERTYISYQRAAAVVKIYGMTAVDVLQFTPKFWNLHLDPIGTLDCAAYTLMTIQINLAGGTLAPFAGKHPQYRKLLDQILNFDISAQYLLTEVGHGLDAKNMETTATMLPNGEFDLHTPKPSGAKIMPPAAPVKGFPRVGIIFARLILSGEGRGIRPFITWLSDGEQMCNGVTAKLLPRRAASKPLDHAITTFTHVRLPQSALLGSLDKPKDMRKEFLLSIWRVRVGSLALPLQMISAMKRGVFVAGNIASDGTYWDQTRNLSPLSPSGLNTAPYCMHWPSSPFLTPMLKRASRLTSEILLNRYNMPPAKDPTSLLAKHEQGLLDELRGMTRIISGGHRGEDFDQLVLPRSQEFVEAMGHRIAYEAAIEAGVHSDLVALYEIWVILQDQGWFVQHTSLTRERMFQIEAERLSAVLPQLDTLLDASGAEPYCSAPIASQTSWDHFIDQLETKTGSRTTNIDLPRGGAML